MQNNQENIKVYGADWCGHTLETRTHLDEIGVPYRYINVEQDSQASAWVKDQNDGMEIKPTLDIQGEIVTAPPNSQLDSLLKEHGLL
ncbi:MAG TPA: glutaredoxin family protein [Chloroflexia bacterium]|nr:glutaredoxin family protein [Chloroflexia bacterium]